MSGLIEKYGIQVGQVYVAADGSRCGHLVTDTVTFAACDDVVTTPFSTSGMGVAGCRIDAFKLAMTRYALVESKPEWFPAD